MKASGLYETRDFEAFFRIYLRLHRRRETRIAHAVATTAMLGCLAVAISTRSLAWLVAAPLVDYAIAQASHRIFEKNRTSPWRRPDYHLRAELRLYWWTLTGRIHRVE